MGKDYHEFLNTQSVILTKLTSYKRNDNFETYSTYIYRATAAAVASAQYGGILGEKYV